MENLKKLYKTALWIGVLFMILACSKQESAELETIQNGTQELKKFKNENLNVFKGPQIQLGNGKARSWISVNQEGFPIEIALEFTSGVYENLDILAFETVLPLHLKAQQLTPFDHIVLNWSSVGHPPAFLVPHFDLHFYMISNEERLAIPEYSTETSALFNNLPPAGYMPSDYGTPPGQGGVYPQMGKHWLPLNLPAYLPFTKIMVLGSFDGEYIFIEPMIALDYLQSNEAFNLDISQPLNFQENTNYPTKYNMYHDDATGNTIISLTDFVSR